MWNFFLVICFLHDSLKAQIAFIALVIENSTLKIWRRKRWNYVCIVYCIILKMGSDLGLIFWNLWIARDASKMSRKWVLTALGWDNGKHLQLYRILGDRIDARAKQTAGRGLFLIIKWKEFKSKKMANLFTTCIKTHDNSAEKK